MRILALMILGLMVAGCVSGPTWVSDPSDPNNVKIEKLIRGSSNHGGLNKPTGELTKADLEKVKRLSLLGNRLTSVKGLEKLTKLKSLNLRANQLTDVRGLEKLTQLEDLWLEDNPDLTKAQIDKLKKSLPNCNILSDF